MLQYQLRVVEEKRDLDARLAKLSGFLASPACGNVAKAEVALLVEQQLLMQGYAGVLAKRIEAF